MSIRQISVTCALVATLLSAARGEDLAAFDGRCIPAGCVAPRSNAPGILGRRAWPAGRLARLAATPDFHHGLPGALRPHAQDTGSAARPSADGAASQSSGTATPDADAASAPVQDPATPSTPAQGQTTQPPEGQAPTATFREGINFVRVDVIVTDKEDQPVTDLQASDFVITEDGEPQSISQFELIRIGGPPSGDPPREIRNRDDEVSEAARDDVRVFAILLDDYHVRLGNSISIREPLTRFIQTQLRPHDLVTVMYPMTPVSDLSFTHDFQATIKAIEGFQGRKFDYQPLNDIEARYARYPTEVVERIRNQVVMGALRGLSVRLGSMRPGRKSIIFVSEGFTVQLPPQMRRRDATLPERRATSVVDPRFEQTQETFSRANLYGEMREVYDAANRNNTSIYSLDPRGLAALEFDIDDGGPNGPPDLRTDHRSLQLTQDTLRSLSLETDGLAIVNRNQLDEGLAQIARDASVYYLIGYNSTQAPADGKFHAIEVKLKRKGLDVRARKGYWAATAADVLKAETPTELVAEPIQQALASIAPSVLAAKYVRTWIGTERGENGKTHVTFVWEPLPQSPNREREEPGRVSLLAATSQGDLVFRGRSPDAASGQLESAGSHRLAFDAPPGSLELRMTVEGAGGIGTLDQEIRTIQVPDLTAPQAAISTPRVFRSRTAREFRALASDPAAVPVADREFSRTERLLIRFSTYGPGTARPQPTAVLLNRTGQKMSDIPVTPATVGGTHEIDLGLHGVAAGEYLIEITVVGPNGTDTELIPIRVTS